MIDTRTIQTKTLFSQIRRFLKQEPIPRTESTRSDLLKLTEFGQERLGPEYRQKLARAIRTCDAYMERLQTAKGVIVGWGDLVKDLIDRKAGLIREIEQFEIFSLNPGEKEAFSSDVQTLQDSAQFGMDGPLPTPHSTPRKMQQDLSGAGERIMQCRRCGAYVQIHGIPPETLPGQPGPKLLVPEVYCPVCGHVIGRGSTTQRVRI